MALPNIREHKNTPITAQFDSCAEIALVNLIYILSSTLIDMNYPRCPETNGRGCTNCIFMVKSPDGRYWSEE